MRILLVNKFYHVRGGTERYFFDLARLLEANHHTIIPFAMAHRKNLPSPYTPFFVREVSLEHSADLRQPLTVLSAAARAVYSREARHNLAALVDREPPDVAYLHNIHHQLSLSILPILKQRGIPILWRLHDYALYCPNSSFYTHGRVCEACAQGAFYHAVFRACRRGSRGASLVACVASYLDRFLGLASLVDLFVAPSRFLAAKMAEYGLDERRLVVQPNFVDVKAGFLEVGAGPFRPSGDLLFFSGRLVREKGVETLIRAVAQVPGARLIIAGDGPQRSDLEALARQLAPGQIAFAGHRTREEVLALLGAALAVVVPSEWFENCPYAILEALAAGRPVIASRIGGIPELVRDEHNGLLFEAGNVDQLADCIRQIVPWSGASKFKVRLLEEYGPAAHYAGFVHLCARLGLPST